MRPRKFRAWDADRHKMFSDPKWVEFVFDKEGRLSARNFDRSGKVQELTIMQFTGLLDSQGVEIYEGDIIVSRDVSASGRRPSALGAEIQVIGNIHENPELLK